MPSALPISFAAPARLPTLLGFANSKNIVVAPEHLELATQSLWLFIAAVLVFFVVRPELWRRLAIGPVDPRPAALTRIFFGITIFWTLLDLTMWGEILFTDQGMFTTEIARKKYGGGLRTAWDPVHGFEDWKSMFGVLGSSWTVLHMRSDPPFVYTIYGLTFASVACMTLGFRTRLTTFLSFVGVMQIYNYTPIWYAGGDTVTRCMLVLGVFSQWGEAYSIDAWRRRRKAILGGAEHVPAYRPIPAWPQRLMMLQLAVIYCSTGVLKSGHTWGHAGTAIYYAVNLDHFYRFPQTGFSTLMYRIGAFRLMTWIVHWWECLFPIALVGVALVAFERTRRNTPPTDPEKLRAVMYRDVAQQPWVIPAAWRRVLSWVVVGVAVLLLARVGGLAAQYHYNVRYLPPFLRLGPERLGQLASVGIVLIPALAVGLYIGISRFSAAAYARIDALEQKGEPVPTKTRVAAKTRWFVLHWMLGKRIWLGAGTGMHLGIAVLLNVGTFVHVMLSVYPVWLTGEELDRIWRYLGSKPAFFRHEMPLPSGASFGEKLRHRLRNGLPARLGARVIRRVPATKYVVLHAPDDMSVRRAALLRCWDISHRLRFEADPDVGKEQLVVRTPDGARYEGSLAGAELTNLFPGLWLFWLPGFAVEQVVRPLGVLPDGLRGALGYVAMRMVGQRG